MSAQTSHSEILETVLLLALPASGKSEIRKYLAGLSAEECRKDFHMGPTAQLDDYPYVHMMRQIDDRLADRRKPRFFFQAPDRPFQDPRHWGTLISLINEDYDDLLAHRKTAPKSAALQLMERIDAAAARVKAPRLLGAIDDETRGALVDALEREARELLDEKNANCSQDLSGKTIVIEFARGGAHGSAMPLQEPFGYRYSLSLLSDTILKNASILYVWVTPEESRRKNEARADPNNPGSILHHGVPIEVMMNDYGCDDMTWLEETSDRPGSVSVRSGGKSYRIPVSRFDNRVDKTSFVRSDRAKWQSSEIRALHEGLRSALERLASLASKR